MINVIPVVGEGLGNSAYLADLGDGRALTVDVPRDLRTLRHAASRRGLTVAFAADTHLHADFLSGAGTPVVTMCGHGERAASAASVLERAGVTDVALLPGGPDDWAAATGQFLEADL